MTAAPVLSAPAVRAEAVCAYDDLVPERGVAALVNGVQVAVFRTHDGRLYAVGNRDPFSGAYVVARGIVGTAGSTPTVSSPMHKQVFDLRTGYCLTDPAVRLPTYPVDRDGGVVRITVWGAMRGGAVGGGA